MEMHNEIGFTLIEAVVTMLVISIIASVAIPRFIDLGSTSKESATTSIAAALAAASAANYAVRSEQSSKGVRINNCNDIGALLPEGLPSDYTISSKALGDNVTSSCTVNGFGTVVRTFAGTGIN